MKVIIIKGNLKTGLGIVERASGENQNLPILKNVLIETEQNRIKVTATNLEVAISYFVSGKVIESGKVTVPLATFYDVVSTLQTERLNLEKKKYGLEVKTDNYEAVVQGLPADDFPIIPKLKNTEEFIEIKGETLKEALTQTIISAQASDLRPELHSIYFNFLMDTIVMAATDSFRLSEKKITGSQFKTTYNKEFKILIPLRTCQELLRIIQDSDSVKIYHDQAQILFKTENLEFVSRLTDGVFPDYNAIIPKKFDSEVTLDREEFINAIKLAGIFSSRVNEVKLKIPPAKKNLEIFSADQTLGENKYVLPAKVSGEVKETSFNWRYLADGLKTISESTVFLGLGEENKPALLKSTVNSSFFYILMPIIKT